MTGKRAPAGNCAGEGFVRNGGNSKDGAVRHRSFPTQAQRHSTPAAAAICGSRVISGRSSAAAVAAIRRSPLLGRAHRLSGTAAVFELTGVAALARALELAADGTAVDAEDVPRGENSDTVMCVALRALIRVIDGLGKLACGAQSRPRRRGMLQNG